MKPRDEFVTDRVAEALADEWPDWFKDDGINTRRLAEFAVRAVNRGRHEWQQAVIDNEPEVQMMTEERGFS